MNALSACNPEVPMSVAEDTAAEIQIKPYKGARFARLE
jgi:hypothetical protein